MYIRGTIQRPLGASAHWISNTEDVIITSKFLFSDKLLGTPLCQKCGGLLKPNTISFGQSLRSKDLIRAEELAKSCDLMIAAGSTLVVQPAATFPTLAKEHGAKLVIITLSQTPLDNVADLVFNEPLGSFLQDSIPQ